MARRLFAQNPYADDDEGEELLVRYNLNGIELNEEGFNKLLEEISITPLAGSFTLPWGKERVQLYIGELPLGNALETIVVRKGAVRQLLPGAKIGYPGPRAYYEVCTNPKLLEIARKKLSETPTKT